jgi:isoquinoline 1-oxidoreductase subunit beta
MILDCITSRVEDDKLSRRSFLASTAAVGGGLMLSLSLPLGPNKAAQSGGFAPNAFIRIGIDGNVVLTMPYVEMGQGTYTSIPMLIAEELEVSLKQVRLEHAPPNEKLYANPLLGVQATGNSNAMRGAWKPLREAGATARIMLIAAAAKRWGVDAKSCRAEDGEVIHVPTGRRLKYAELAAEAGNMPVPGSVALKAPEDFKLIGTPVKRLDAPAKVNGTAAYGIDARPPGVKIATLAQSPVFGGRVKSVDDAAAKAVKGVRQIVRLDDAVAVVADHMGAAKKGLAALKIEWEDGPYARLATDDIARELEQAALKSGAVAQNIGDVGKAMASAVTKVESTYHMPFLAHATMEPMNCTARIADGRCEMWAPTQGVELAQGVAAQVTGLPSERIIIHRMLLGGGFGRRLMADFVKLTLLATMAVKQPVKLIWSREEDMTHDFYRPAMLHKASAVLDQAGSPVQISHRVVSPSHLLYVFPRSAFPDMKDWTEPAAPPEKFDTMAVEGLIEAPYDIAGQRVEQHRLDVGVPVSVWRTTGHGPNNFVLESFVDELAAAAKRDPVAYRQSMLRSDTRALKVLNLVAEKSGWGRPAPDRIARGVALAKAFGGYIAAVAEVSVRNGILKVHRITAAVDCGRVIDPGIAASNIQGGVVWGLSAMQTEITFERGEAMQSNFDAFEPMHLWQTPPIEVHFVASDDKPGGTGELGGVPVPAAVCNAIFAATGQRIRALPVSRAGLSFA